MKRRQLFVLAPAAAITTVVSTEVMAAAEIEYIKKSVVSKMVEVHAESMYHLNNDFIRNAVKMTLENHIKNFDVYKSLVVCDETNNTPEIIDINGFAIDVFIKFKKSDIDHWHTKSRPYATSVDFNEIIRDVNNS